MKLRPFSNPFFCHSEQSEEPREESVNRLFAEPVLSAMRPFLPLTEFTLRMAKCEGLRVRMTGSEGLRVRIYC